MYKLDKLGAIDYAKLIFACFIPLLHIRFNNFALDTLTQYVSRMGVPFFFAVSGMMLSLSIQKRGNLNAMTRFLKRTGKLLIIWLIIYIPILWGHYSVREIIFNTPAYLWYITAMIFAALPFCLTKNRKLLYCFSILIYVVGTLYNGSYSWLLGEGLTWYNDIFGTTRNGFMYSLPMMCVGELVVTTKDFGNNRRINVLIILLYIAEVTCVLIYRKPLSDNSMYLTIPLLIYLILKSLTQMNVNPNIYLRKCSSAIYLMQFGIISLFTKVGIMVGINDSTFIPFIIYVFVILIPILLCRSNHLRKLTDLIF